MSNLFDDILKTDHKDGRKFSQGRFYLFVSFVAFLLINIILGYYTINGIEIKDIDSLELISSNLKWALGSFALYVLGGKGIKTFKSPQDEERVRNPYGGKLEKDKEDKGKNKFGPDEEEVL